MLSTAGNNRPCQQLQIRSVSDRQQRPIRVAIDGRFQTDVMLRAVSASALRLAVPPRTRPAIRDGVGASPESEDRIMMTLGWIVLGLVGWALGLVIVLTLFRMAGDQDRAARHEQKRLDPYSDVTITHTGEG